MDDRFRDTREAEAAERMVADARETEITRLRAEVEALKSWQCTCLARPHSEQIAALTTEVEALRPHAELYLWLRAQHWTESPMCVVMHPKANLKLGARCPSGDLLDEAIAAARAAQGGSNG